MRRLALAASAVSLIVLAPLTAGAQSVPGSTNSIEAKKPMMNTGQKAMYDAWPEQQRMDFDTWPATYQTYYWELTPTQQTGYWALNNEQRARIYAMTPEQRTMAWQSIEKQLMAAQTETPMPEKAPMAAETPMAAEMPMKNDMAKGTMAKDSSMAGTKEYPLCSATVKDSCINPREAGKNYGNRPLGYFPDKPTSTM